jgi:hypothetical protein
VKLFLWLVNHQTINIMRGVSVSLPTFLISPSNWVTDWTVGCSYSSKGQEFFSSTKHPDQLWGPPSLLFRGYWGSTPGTKPAEHKFNYTSPYSSRLRMSGAIPLFPLYAFIAWTWEINCKCRSVMWFVLQLQIQSLVEGIQLRLMIMK